MSPGLLLLLAQSYPLQQPNDVRRLRFAVQLLRGSGNLVRLASET
jgi:hypothetical protein